MPIFTVKIAVETKHYSAIVVEAASLKDALEYARDNDKWQEYEEHEQVGDFYAISLTPCSAHEILHIEEIPNGYTPESFPWNGDGERKLKEILTTS